MIVSASTYLDALFLLLGDNSERSRSMVKEFIGVIDKQAGNKEIVTLDDDLIDFYKSLIKTVISDNIHQGDKTSLNMLLLKITSSEIVKSNPVVRDTLTDVLRAESPISADQIDSYLKRIRNILVLADANDAARKVFARAKSIGDMRDLEDQSEEISRLKALLDTSLKSIEQREKTSDSKASESYVSLSDPESIKRSLTVYMERSVTGVIKTGLQGLNRALGDRGGIGLGESVVFAAPSHHYKSGMLVSIMLWAAIYNNIKVSPGKKAMIYFVSLENEVHQNLMQVFKALYCRIEQVHVDLNVLSTDFITEWIANYFKQFDVEVVIDRYVPHEFSVKKFEQRYNSFIEAGYELILFDLDYLSEARGTDVGDVFSPQGQIQLIKENYSRFFNHAKNNGYAFVTGHQLTKRAVEVGGSNRHGVKKFNDSMMADSSDVFRIVDCIIFLYLENSAAGFKFLTAQLRKNRGCQDTKEDHKFFAYPFTEFGIQDDVGGAPKFVTDIDDYGLEPGVAEDAIIEGAMF